MDDNSEHFGKGAIEMTVSIILTENNSLSFKVFYLTWRRGLVGDIILVWFLLWYDCMTNGHHGQEHADMRSSWLQDNSQQERVKYSPFIISAIAIWQTAIMVRNTQQQTSRIKIKKELDAGIYLKKQISHVYSVDSLEVFHLKEC